MHRIPIMLGALVTLAACGTVKVFQISSSSPELARHVKNTAVGFVDFELKKGGSGRSTLWNASVTEGRLCGRRVPDEPDPVCYPVIDIATVYVHERVFAPDEELRQLAPLGVVLCGPLIFHCAAATQ